MTEAKKHRNELILKLTVEGHTNREIMEVTHVSEGTIRRVRKTYGVKSNITKKARAEAYQAAHDKIRLDPSKLVESKCPQFEYVSGYKNCDAKAFIKCRVCGTVFEHSFNAIRKGKQPKCPGCIAAHKAEQQRIKEERHKQYLLRNEALHQEALERKRIQEENKKVQHVCKECGCTFFSSNRRVFCSDECSRKHANRMSSRRKDKRCGKDHTCLITWKQIQNKTHNLTCALCGKPCDTNDYKMVNGAVICGDNFPSVDHIIPIAKGGRDEWSNVQLAHRGCNTHKRDKSLYKVEDEQFAFVI